MTSSSCETEASQGAVLSAQIPGCFIFVFVVSLPIKDEGDKQGPFTFSSFLESLEKMGLFVGESHGIKDLEKLKKKTS